jgi:acyl-CoA thioesterase
LNSIRGEDGHLQVSVGEDWLQGRATFGGLVAAVGNESMRSLVSRELPLRSLHTVLVGPAPPGIWHISARVLRVGKSVTLTQCEISSAGQIAATLTGVYGQARPSVVRFKPQPLICSRQVDDINEVRYQPGVSPAFTQHFAMRWAEGRKPFSGAPKIPTKAFVRHLDPAALSESSVIAIVDCIPTPAIAMFAAPAPASTVTWTLEFFEHEFNFTADQWWRLDADVDAAGEGYVNQTAILNDPNGRPVALSRQLFAVFN